MVIRSFNLDSTTSRAIDIEAERTGKNYSQLANELMAEGIRLRAMMRMQAAEAGVYAGVGVASLTSLLVLAVILG